MQSMNSVTWAFLVASSLLCSVQYISSHLWVHQLPKPCAKSNQNGIISSLFPLMNVVWRVFIMGFILLCGRTVLTVIIELMRTGVFLYVLPPVHPVVPPPESLSLSGDLLFLFSWRLCWFSTRLVCSIKRDLSGVVTWSSPTHWKHCYIQLLPCIMQPQSKGKTQYPKLECILFYQWHVKGNSSYGTKVCKGICPPMSQQGTQEDVIMEVW